MTGLSLFARSAPRSPEAHIVRAGDRHQLFLPNGSQLFDIDAELADAFDRLLAQDNQSDIRALIHAHGLGLAPQIDDTPLAPPPTRALSLAVAQTCNLGCGYCYAQGGGFGGAAKSMAVETALRSVDLLLADVKAGERANLAFLGGEPLVAREVIVAATRYAAEEALARGIRLGFSITTNGTLLTAADAELFEAHGFAVTISIDGLGDAHDRTRPYKNGRGSYAALMARVQPLLQQQRRMQVSARVTVTPGTTDLPVMLDGLIDMGFHSVGFSPMLSAPTGSHEMQHADLELMLGGMVACATEFEARVAKGERYPFANMHNALREIHKGTHRPYPCGAGAGYLGVSADGALSACHRFVGDEAGALGSLSKGVDRTRQAQWLSERHVSRQEPCSECWARFLCAGGCHHETLSRGRPACDFIRGWLHHCIGAYGRLSVSRPDLFEMPTRA